MNIKKIARNKHGDKVLELFGLSPIRSIPHTGKFTSTRVALSVSSGGRSKTLP